MLVNVGKLMSHTSTKGGGGFNPSLVDAWFMSGLSNSDKPTQIVGVKKNKLQLKNFAYALNSGFGEYAVDFTLWEGTGTTSDSVSIIKEAGRNQGFALIYYSQMTSDIPSYSIKITGLNSGEILFYYRNSEGVEKQNSYTKDGVYTLPICYKEGTGGTSSGFTIKTTDKITITQLPTAYEGALVFDGVDDYALCNNLPILTDYTVICRRVIEEKNNFIVASKGYDPNSPTYSGAFLLERQSNINNKGEFSFGLKTSVLFSDNEIIYQTKNQYMSIPIKYGDAVDNNNLTLGILSTNALYSCFKGAIYYFALYDKSLTPEEIEIEKERLNEEWIKRLTKPIINYVTLNQNITDSATMLSGDINGQAIQLIRQNSHRVLGKYIAPGKMTYCRLKDDDGTKYHDGTTATLTGEEGDVFVKLPQFYWKVTQESTDIFKIGLAYGGNPGSGWKEWKGNQLIGAYEAYETGEKTYSRSGVDSTGSVSQPNFKSHARSRGSGYCIVTWEQHCMMAMLYYCMYGHMNCRVKVGKGTNSYQKSTGATNALGMTDTVAGGNGDSNSINFWGLENWWGNKYEWVEGIESNSGVATITDLEGNTRTVQAYDVEGRCKKMVIGEYFDLIGKEAKGNTGYCDYYYLSVSDTSRALLRSYGGIVFFDMHNTAFHISPSVGSRLAFIGDLVEAESVSAFKAIAVTN